MGDPKPFRKRHHAAGKAAQPTVATELLALVKEQLEPQAYSQKRAPLLDPRVKRFEKLEPDQTGYRFTEGADPGQHHTIRPA